MKILFVRANKIAATKKWHSESGQSVILISMVLLSFLMFFGFAINTGLLIAAKISVQSAADAAAYAGAATQARQLNGISYLNYDMRRQFKKFMYRYAFAGNVSNAHFSTDATGVSGNHYGYPKFWYATSDSASRTEIPIKVPVVCIPMTGSASDNDNCQQLNLPNTTKQYGQWFPAGGLTTVTQSLMTSAANIQTLLEDQCQKSGGINLFVLMEWLFRGDTNPATLNATIMQMANKLSATDQAAAIAKIDHLVDGLGLYPRNILNFMRIQSLTLFLNTPAAKKVQKDKITSMEHAQDAEINERTIQAFKSALSNLNNDVMDHNSVEMSELQNDHQIDIELIETSFNAYVQYMVSNSGASDDTYCQSKIIPFQAKNAPVGVKKTGSSTAPPVHYAVKIKAKAKLLFLPLADGIELEAFASAKPFGSRIGPANLSGADFVENITPTPVGSDPINSCGDADTKCYVPNLKISATDTFFAPAYLQSLFQIGATPNAGGVGFTFTFQGLDNAIAPQPAEIGHYNVIPPPKDATEMQLEFIPYATDKNSQTNIYRFYAPIFSGNIDPKTQITNTMNIVFPNAVSGTGNPFAVDMSKIKADLQTHMFNYLSSLTAGGDQSEHGETETFTALELPMSLHYSAPPKPIDNAHPNFWLTQPNQVLSSWAPDYVRGVPTFTPRFGYSVKFVAMQNLLHNGSLGPDSDQGKVAH